MKQIEGQEAHADWILSSASLSAAERLGADPLFRDEANWFPLASDLYSRLTPNHWQQHLHRYFRGIEEACEEELARACVPLCVRLTRIRRKYNVTYVETFWEWVARDPIATVNDLIPFARTFTSRNRTERVYETVADTERIRDLTILRIETAPGELLKIYPKTNRRIRMEVQHILTGENRFQFPRERNASGHPERSSSHTFKSIEGMMGLFERLQKRAASVVNDFLRHVAEQAEVAPSAVSAFDALLGVLNAVSNDHLRALEVASLLIQGGGMTPGGSQLHQQTIAALRHAGIIELNRTRTRYVLTADYRHPFQMLREHGSFPFLTQRGEERIQRRTRTVDHHILLD